MRRTGRPWRWKYALIWYVGAVLTILPEGCLLRSAGLSIVFPAGSFMASRDANWRAWERTLTGAPCQTLLGVDGGQLISSRLRFRVIAGFVYSKCSRPAIRVAHGVGGVVGSGSADNRRDDEFLPAWWRATTPSTGAKFASGLGSRVAPVSARRNRPRGGHYTSIQNPNRLGRLFQRPTREFRPRFMFRPGQNRQSAITRRRSSSAEAEKYSSSVEWTRRRDRATVRWSFQVIHFTDPVGFTTSGAQPRVTVSGNGRRGKCQARSRDDGRRTGVVLRPGRDGSSTAEVAGAGRNGHQGAGDGDWTAEDANPFSTGMCLPYRGRILTEQRKHCGGLNDHLTRLGGRNIKFKQSRYDGRFGTPGPPARGWIYSTGFMGWDRLGQWVAVEQGSTDV